MIQKSYLLGFLLVIFLSFNAFTVKAQKTDTLYHINGNVLRGEIKKYDMGLLYFKMDGMGTIKVENMKIKSLRSSKMLRVITKNNKVYYGDIDSSLNIGEIKIGLLDSRDRINISDIVEIYPIKGTFMLRLSGKADFGIDYSKSNSMLRVNGSGNVNYRVKKWASEFSYSSLETVQEISDSVINNSKTDISISTEYLFSPSRRISLTIGMNTNTELGIAMRLYSGLSSKHYLIQNNRNKLFFELGFNANYENSIEDISTTNPEGIIGIDYSIFKYNSPEIDLSTHAQVIPNLTFNGRWRLDSGFKLTIEIFYNFFVKLETYYLFDSKPISVGASNNDWGFMTGVGYSFN